MALSGDIKQNYLDLQQSTGERFASMADRVTTDHVQGGTDDQGQRANNELADWLRKQPDDEKAVARVARADGGQAADEAPKQRTATSGNKQNG